MKTVTSFDENLPWNDSFLDSVAKKPFSPLSFLHRMATKRDQYRFMIDQLHSVWRALPPAMKEDKALMRRIRSPENESLWGAFNEVVGYWYLRRYTAEIEYSPKVGDKTPDFQVQVAKDTFYCEVFSLSQDEIQARDSRDLTMFRDEIKKIRLKLKISLARPPIPNAQKNFHGLAKALERYLKNLETIDPKQEHEIQSGGASIRFRVSEWPTEGPVYFGGLGGMFSGDPHVQLLLNNLDAKTSKYKFPFVGLCMVHSGWANLDTLTEAMTGDSTFPLSNKSTGRGSLSKEPFWSPINPALKSNNRLVGLIYCRVTMNDDGKIELQVHTAKNQHVDSTFSEIFSDIPDVFLAPHDGFRLDMPPAKFVPE